MKKKVEQTMTWDEANEAIDPTMLGQILAIGPGPARKIFKRYDFPIIPETEGNPKADKEAARLYIQGQDFKNHPKEKIEYLILMELRKLTKEFHEIKTILKEQFSCERKTIVENSNPNMKGDEIIE